MEVLMEIFNSLASNKKEMRNFAMFFLTTFVNEGIMSIQWDMDTQQFVFTVYNDVEEVESSEAPALDVDAFLAEAMKRRKSDGLK